MHLHEADDYRAYVRHCLEQGTPARPRSTKKALADHLRCHATFVSHVVAGKADLSTEQAVRFCDFYGLDADGIDYFLDLVQRDRAGDERTRGLFDARLARRREAWLTLQSRLKAEERLSGDDERRYFESWLLQLAHLACMLPDRGRVADVARTLGLPTARVASALQELQAMGLLAEARPGSGVYETRPKRIHLDKSSPTFKTCHGNWRLKIAADVAAAPARSEEGVHYTSAMTISREAALKLRQAVLEHIERARAAAVASPPEEIYVLALDLYPVTPAAEKS